MFRGFLRPPERSLGLLAFRGNRRMDRAHGGRARCTVTLLRDGWRDSVKPSAPNRDHLVRRTRRNDVAPPLFSPVLHVIDGHSHP